MATRASRASVYRWRRAGRSIEPKLPWPSTSGTRIDQSWVMGERLVDRGVAVRVVFAHDVADDLGPLAVGTPGDEAASWRVEDLAVDRLQPVAHVGQARATITLIA